VGFPIDRRKDNKGVWEKERVQTSSGRNRKRSTGGSTDHCAALGKISPPPETWGSAQEHGDYGVKLTEGEEERWPGPTERRKKTPVHRRVEGKGVGGLKEGV